MPAILITGVGGCGVGSQIKECLLLGDLPGLNLIGTDINPRANSSGLAAFYPMPVPNGEAYIQALISIIRMHDVRLIFVSTLPEAHFLATADHRRRIEDLGTRLVLTQSDIIELCMDKYALFSHLRDHGISVPRFDLISCPEDCERIDYFPIVLKDNRHTGSSDNIFMVFDNVELECLSQYLLHRGIDIFAQAYMGDASNEISIGVTTDESGNAVGSIALQRSFTDSLSVLQKYHHSGKVYPISSGISTGTIIHNEALLRQAIAIAQALHIRGSVNIQGKYVNGILYPFDIHPAMTGSVYAKALAGYNEPLYYVNLYILDIDSPLIGRCVEVGRRLEAYLQSDSESEEAREN